MHQPPALHRELFSIHNGPEKLYLQPPLHHAVTNHVVHRGPPPDDRLDDKVDFQKDARVIVLVLENDPYNFRKICEQFSKLAKFR